MSEWITVATIAQVPPGARYVAHTPIGAIIIVNLDGDFYAVQDMCSHDGGSLSNGRLENDELICPRHGAHFCVKTGEALTPPAYEAIQTYPVKISNGKININIA